MNNNYLFTTSSKTINEMKEIWKNNISKIQDLKITKKVTVKHKSDEIQINQYIHSYEDYLGKGFYGSIYKVYNVLDHQYYACKIFNRNFLKKTIQVKDDFIKIDKLVNKEIMALSKLDHPNLLSAYELINDPNKNIIYLILELCDGELCNYNYENLKYDNRYWIKPNYEYLCEQAEPDEERIRIMFREIAEGVDYLHRLNLVHCDIRPQNIMTKAGHVKILDFSSLAYFEKKNPKLSSNENYLGTPYFLAPEALSLNDKSHLDYAKLDVWAIGVTYFVCSFGFLPFAPHLTSEGGIEPANFQIQWELVDTVYKYSMQLRLFLEWILNHDANLRPSVADILKHEYLCADEKNFFTGFFCYTSEFNEFYENFTTGLCGQEMFKKESFENQNNYIIDSNSSTKRDYISLSNKLTYNINDHFSNFHKNSEALSKSNNCSLLSESEFSFKSYNLSIRSDSSQITNSIRSINDYSNNVSNSDYVNYNKNRNLMKSIKKCKDKLNNVDNFKNNINRFRRNSQIINIDIYSQDKIIIARNKSSLNVLDKLFNTIYHKQRSYNNDQKYRRISDSSLLDYIEINNKFQRNDPIVKECIKNIEDIFI